MECLGALGIHWNQSALAGVRFSPWQDLKDYGAIVFRGFEISKDKQTFGQVTWILDDVDLLWYVPVQEYFDIPTSP